MHIHSIQGKVLHQVFLICCVGLGMYLCIGSALAKNDAQATGVLFQDQFERTEKDQEKEQPGNGWGTNSKTRAKGLKQVFLGDGKMHIKRAAVADHGVSVTQDVSFRNAHITLQFMVPKNGDLGINIADMNEKSVHAGHICMARIKPTSLEIVDLKTGRMKKEMHEKNKAKQLTKADKAQIARKSIILPLKLKTGIWHDLEILIMDDTMTVKIDARKIGSMTSPGIAHETKRRIRLAVNTEAWVDDITISAIE
ncbi:hypothetical protein N9A92_00340 [Pirellulales bacterium]|nr:hypothetical protein [Pirellulales bacterium]